MRPSCVSAMPQSMRSQPERQTCLQQADALRPTCGGRGAGRASSLSPTDEAINPKRRTIAQRKERSTPNARPVSSGGSDQLPTTGRVSSGRRAYHSNRRTGPRTESYVKSVVSARAGCEGPTSNSALPAFPRGRPGESESSSGHARATGTTHPGFYGRKPWRKPNSALIITRPGASMRGPAGPLPHIAAKVFTKVDNDPHALRRAPTSAEAPG